MEKAIKHNAKKFKKRVCPIPYMRYGIKLWEGLALCTAMQDVDLIIESGTAQGRSTEILARYFTKPIITVDTAIAYGVELTANAIKRLHEHSHLRFIRGDSMSVIPRIVDEYSNISIGVFIDGPKGLWARLLTNLIMPRVDVVAVHDIWTDCLWAGTHPDLYWQSTREFAEKYSYLELESDPEHPLGTGIGILRRRT